MLNVQIEGSGAQISRNPVPLGDVPSDSALTLPQRLRLLLFALAVLGCALFVAVAFRWIGVLALVPVVALSGLLTWFWGPAVGAAGAAVMVPVHLEFLTHFPDPDRPALSSAVVLAAFGLLLVPLVARLVQAMNASAHAAAHDPLTGALNRRALGLDLERARPPYTLAVIDIDGFKALNDRDGHTTGDQLLVALVRSLQAAVRPTDRVYRLGGDEFALLLCGELPEPELRARLAQAWQQIRRQGYAQIAWSVGVAQHGEARPERTLLQLADERMYAEKHAARTLGSATGHEASLEAGVEKRAL